MKRKIKFIHNKKKLIAVIFLLILLSVLVFLLQQEEEEILVCRRDKDCVKQQITCCGCNMGGKEKCMTKGEAKEWQEKLNKECEEGRLCIAMYACQESVCKCIEGNCTEIPEKFANG